ncbi:sensor histidine kinase [Actinomadura kijaniata]|uniref:histidine kinase n=1 Tax=Actinomadura namibiensis TaxID=182080 RepID=A0A7W3LVP1_ACTNM|nr:histidine kinase [Actinomadura namibiensis]MBA8955143.1 signal transduction histidine kinase [Actinomadura namibiensis]
MPASASPASPWPGRLRRAAWTLLSWCGVTACTTVMFATLPRHAAVAGIGAYVAPALLMALPVLLWRRRPEALVPLMLLGWVAVVAVEVTWPLGYLKVAADDLAVALVAATRSRRAAAALAVPTLGAHLTVAALFAHGPALLSTATSVVLAFAAALATGLSARQRREHAAALHAQATSRAVTAERLRIARELHDMVAHSIGVIAIQAGVGARVIDSQPAKARDALTAIEGTSRETLAGLRRMLGALRQAEPGETAAPAPLDPVPGLADLDRLAATTGNAGVRVEVRWEGGRRALPPEVDAAAFRIVQEAVANVVRHARADECRVTVGYRDGDLTIEVVDDGRGSGGGEGGFGIVGMRERAGLLHGTLDAGPRPEGGFRVAARLPVPAAAR